MWVAFVNIRIHVLTPQRSLDSLPGTTMSCVFIMALTFT